MDYLKKILKKGVLYLLMPLSFFPGCTSVQEENNTPYVIGSIIRIKRAEIPNMAGKPSRYETWFTLDVTKAFDGYDNPIDVKDYKNATFAGPPDLLDKFSVSQKVKIVCNSQTGRHVKEITPVEK